MDATKCDDCGVRAPRISVGGLVTATGLRVELDPPERLCLPCYRARWQQARLGGLLLDRTPLHHADAGVLALTEAT